MEVSAATECLNGPPPYNCQGCNLSGINLAGKDLTGAQLQGATLTGTIFSGAISMARADLTGAVMGNGTNFSGCNLTDTIFGPHPDFGSNSANLTTFAGATIPYRSLGPTWSYIDLTGAIIPDLPHDLSGITVRQSDLSGMDFSGRTLTNAHFYGVVARSAKFCNGTLDNIVFAQGQVVCDLTGAEFCGSETRITAGVFDTSTLTDTDFTGADLSGSSFLQARMDGTSFDDTDVTSCTFSVPPRFSTDPTNLTSFRGATLNSSTILKDWSYLDLTGAILVGLASGVDLTYLQALYSVLTGMDFSNYTLNHCDLTGATLTGVKFVDAHMDDALLYGVQNSCELFRVTKGSTEYGPFLQALQDGNVADVADAFARCGHPISGTRSAVETDDPNRWWTVTDDSSVYVVANATVGSSALLIIMSPDLRTRFDGASLRGANFSPDEQQRTVLRGVSFNGATMDGDTDFSLADLGPVNPHDATTASQFKSAIMNGVGFSGADLTAAQFTGTVELHNADLASATLKGADLTGAQLGALVELFRVPQTSTIDYDNFIAALQAESVGGVSAIFAKYGHPIASGQTSVTIDVATRAWTVTDSSTQTLYTVLNWTSSDNSTFLIVSTQTEAAALTAAYMPGATLVDANLYGISATDVQLYGTEVRLDGAILDNSKLTSANLGGSSLIVDSLYGVDLSNANLINSKLAGAALTDAVTLSGASVQGTDFTGTHMNGWNLANAAVAVDVTPTVKGVYLFALEPTDPDTATALTELKSAVDQVNLTPDGNEEKIQEYITDLNNGYISDLLLAFEQYGITFSPQATIERTDDPNAWQFGDPPPSGKVYTVWHGFDELGTEGVLARPSLPVLQQVFQRYESVVGVLRWQASVTDPAENQFQIDNDSENPFNLQLGYATLFVTQEADRSLTFYGTTLRIEQLGGQDKLEIRIMTFDATILCRNSANGVQQCHDDGSGSFFGPNTICPNDRTLTQNQNSVPPVPWAQMLRAPSPPAPPTCVPSPYGDCPQVSASDIGRRGP